MESILENSAIYQSLTWRDCIMQNIWMLLKMNIVCLFANTFSSYKIAIYFASLVLHCLFKKLLGKKLEFFLDI